MSAELTLNDTDVIAFGANMRLRPQQLQSRLVGRVVSDLSFSAKGKMFTSEFQGESEPQQRSGRAPATPEGFVAEDRRVGFFTAFDDGKWIDSQDMLDKLADPTNGVVQSMLAGKERARDRLIIQTALGPARAGETGQNVVNLPAGQIIGIQENTFYRGRADGVAAPSAADQPLTVAKLQRANEILDEAEFTGGVKTLACCSNDLQMLLTSLDTRSSDFNTVKALVNGEISSFCGFEFVRLQKRFFPIVSSARRLVAFVREAIEYKSTDIEVATITKRADRSYTPHAYYSFRHGALRAFDTGVVALDVINS